MTDASDFPDFDSIDPDLILPSEVIDEMTEDELAAYLLLLNENAKEWRLQPHQQRAEDLSKHVDEIMFGGSAGPGKALAVDTPIPTPAGMVPIGSLKDGDLVFDEKGSPCRVVKAHDPYVAEEVYRLTFDDGASILADARHLWLTFNANELGQLTKADPERMAKRRATRPSRAKDPNSLRSRMLAERNAQRSRPGFVPTGTVRSTAEIVETLHIGTRSNHAVPLAGGVERAEVNLPIDPYVLGMWLGDGTTKYGSITTADPEVVKWVAEHYEPGFVTVDDRSASNTYGFKGLITDLRTAGVLDNKHVPDLYLLGSTKQRLELLKGLMDSDGTVTKDGGVEFCSTKKELTYGVYRLAISLGHKVHFPREGRSKFQGRDCGPKWTVKWTAPECVFRLERKASKQQFGKSRRLKFRYIVSAERVEPTLVRCITVDSPNSLYLAGESHIVTHNTEWLMHHAWTHCLKFPGLRVLMIRRTFPQLRRSLIERSLMRFDPKKAKYMPSEKRWKFNNGSEIEFGFCDAEEDYRHYLSAEADLVCFEELTELTQMQYQMISSRCRTTTKKLAQGVRPHIISATNPGLAGHCVPYGEVLTPSGWVDIRDMAVGDRVMTVDHDGLLFESKVEQVHRSTYVGPMVNVKTKGLRMTCTPNHKVAKAGGIREGRNTRDGAGSPLFSLVPFEDLPGQATIYRSVYWNGDWHPGVELEPSSRRVGPPRLDQPLRLSSVQYAKLVGWFISEGCVSPRDNRVDIAQKKPASRERLRAFLEDDCGFRVSWSASAAYIHSHEWHDHFSGWGRSWEKRIPRSLLEADTPVQEALLETLMDGDGHRKRGDTGGTYYTSSPGLADDVAELCVKLGYLVWIRVRDRRGAKVPTGTTNHLSHEVCFKRTKSGGTELLTGNHKYGVGTTTKRRSEVSFSDFEGEVYCIGVPETHSFLIRQEGTIWISGNSWVRERFVYPTNYGEKIAEIDISVNGQSFKRKIGFVPARVTDNRFIDPGYVASLASLPEHQQKLYLHGDWDAFEGAYFEEFDREKHIVAPFNIPKSWPRVRGIDYGLAKPFGCLWVAFDWDGNAYVYREAYETNLTATEQAKLVVSMSKYPDSREYGRHANKAEDFDRTVADPSVFNKTGSGRSIAQMYADGGLHVQKAMNARVDGWNRVKDYMRGNDHPRLFIFSTCTNFIKEISGAVRDDRNPEDLDTTLPDHLLDCARYALAARARSAPGRKKERDPRSMSARMDSIIKARGKQGHETLGSRW